LLTIELSASPVYFFQGGILMTLGGLLEWILGNSFPAVVFCTFGTFWLSYGGVLNPSFAAFSSFAGENEAGAEGLKTTGFNAGLGKSLFIAQLIKVSPS
jgi:succinate-acetate transporter protein